MSSVKVFLDDMRIPSMVFGEQADKEWVTVATVEEVIALLLAGNVSHLSLDNDLGPGEPEGHTAVTWMIENNVWPTTAVYAHTGNIVRREQMRLDIACHFKPKI
jgi:hypothetical protein